VSSEETARRRQLLAGSLGPERVPASPDAEEPRWFEPLHVRDPAGTRERIAAQVAAGATVVVAPTWRTHRRALMAVGETRRAGAWTSLAVQVCREGIEVGMERRIRAREAPEIPFAAGPDASSDEVLVAGVVPPMDEEPDPGTGRLALSAVASERDHRELAGHLADAAADLLLVTPRQSLAQSRVAAAAAVESGLPAWVSTTIGPAEARTEPRLPDGAPLEAWLEQMRESGAAAVLVARVPPGALPPADATSARLREGRLPWGTLGAPEPPRAWGPPEMERWAGAWLEAGAEIVGLEDGATPERVAAVRDALDAAEAADLAGREERLRRWREFITDAARGTPGGPALWVGPRAPGDLPAGFDWTVAPPGDVERLPAARYRLVVCPAEADVPLSRIATAMDEGGLLVAAVPPGRLPSAADLRILSVAEGEEGTLVLLRRDPA
jgi:S-methylmethionine-dependent homocysteine/selenocysteine methylase